jgi:uncharacterized Fe-S cluster-containing MiaB family protein
VTTHILPYWLYRRDIRDVMSHKLLHVCYAAWVVVGGSFAIDTVTCVLRSMGCCWWQFHYRHCYMCVTQHGLLLVAVSLSTLLHVCYAAWVVVGGSFTIDTVTCVLRSMGCWWQFHYRLCYITALQYYTIRRPDNSEAEWSSIIINYDSTIICLEVAL